MKKQEKHDDETTVQFLERDNTFDENKQDLFIDDEGCFHFPCYACLNRLKEISYCRNCRYYAD